MNLTKQQAEMIYRFDDDLWMQRIQIDPTRTEGKCIRDLIRLGYVVKRNVLGLPTEYALTDLGLSFRGLPPAGVSNLRNTGRTNRK